MSSFADHVGIVERVAGLHSRFAGKDLSRLGARFAFVLRTRSPPCRRSSLRHSASGGRSCRSTSPAFVGVGPRAASFLHPGIVSGLMGLGILACKKELSAPLSGERMMGA